MPPVGRPVHGIDLSEMALQRPLWPHQLVPGNRFMGLSGDGADWATTTTVSLAIQNGGQKSFALRGDSRVVSASSSFFLLILSLSVSASRRACWMRACIASGDTSLGRPESISAAKCALSIG